MITETRTEPTNERARRRFRLYWTLISAFAALTRRLVLNEVAAEAEQRFNSGLGSSPAREGREREIRARRDAICARQRSWEDFDVPGDGYCAGEEGSTSVGAARKVPKVADDAAPETITVVLADDHEIVRDGIRMVLEAEADVEVVAEAGDADSAARYVLGHKPTVLVLDLSMPGTPSLEILPKIAATSPDTAVVVLTMQNEPAFAREALGKGARGYVIKHSAASSWSMPCARRSPKPTSTPSSGRGWSPRPTLGHPTTSRPVRSRSSALWRSAI